MDECLYDTVYVLVRETWDGYTCLGLDLYYSLNKENAVSKMIGWAAEDPSLSWDEDRQMWFYGNRYHWEKLYVDERPLDEED